MSSTIKIPTVRHEKSILHRTAPSNQPINHFHPHLHPLYAFKMTQIKVARFQGPSNETPLKIGTAEKPIPGPKDVLVKVHACNVVPNTANMLTNTDSLPEGFNIAMDPIAFGLDASGTIEAVGEHVLNLKVGDRVYVDPYLTCDTCQACRRGMYCLIQVKVRSLN